MIVVSGKLSRTTDSDQFMNLLLIKDAQLTLAHLTSSQIISVEDLLELSNLIRDELQLLNLGVLLGALRDINSSPGKVVGAMVKDDGVIVNRQVK